MPTLYYDAYYVLIFDGVNFYFDKKNYVAQFVCDSGKF